MSNSGKKQIAGRTLANKSDKTDVQREHRLTNRWGLVTAKTPEKTLVALEAKLPKEHWVDINRLLVPFGKHICTGNLPKCSTCPVLEMCQQVRVTKHR